MCPRRGFGAVIVSTGTVLAPVVDGQVEIAERLMVVVRNPGDHRFGNLPGNNIADIFNPTRV